MKRILIIGVSSFIGSNLASYFRKTHRVFGTFLNHKPNIDDIVAIKITTNDIHDIIKKIKPDCIFYCLNVKKPELEKEPNLGIEININLPISILKQNKSFRFIYFSSAEIFDGEKGNYEEEDQQNPSSIFGILKAKAEKYLKEFENVTILRIGTPIGFGSYFNPSLFDYINEMLKTGKRFELDSCQKHSMYDVKDLAKALDVLINNSDSERLYNFSNGQKLTHFELGKLIAKIFNYDSNLIFTKDSKRLDFSLDGSLFCQKFLFRFKNIFDLLNSFKAELMI